MRKLNSAEKFNERAMTGLMNGITDAIYQNIYVTRSEQVVDATLYAAKTVGAVASFSDLFKRDDAILTGKTNVSQAKVDANTAFLCTAIAIQYSVAAGATDDNVRQATYGLLHNNMRNGELTVKAGNRPIVEQLSGEVFYSFDAATAIGDTNAAAGTAVTYTMVQPGIGVYELENPKWIYPNDILSADFKFAGNLDANGAVKIILIGAKNAAL